MEFLIGTLPVLSRKRQGCGAGAQCGVVNISALPLHSNVELVNEAATVLDLLNLFGRVLDLQLRPKFLTTTVLVLLNTSRETCDLNPI